MITIASTTPHAETLRLSDAPQRVREEREEATFVGARGDQLAAVAFRHVDGEESCARALELVSMLPQRAKRDRQGEADEAAVAANLIRDGLTVGLTEVGELQLDRHHFLVLHGDDVGDAAVEVDFEIRAVSCRLEMPRDGRRHLSLQARDLHADTGAREPLEDDGEGGSFQAVRGLVHSVDPRLRLFLAAFGGAGAVLAASALSGPDAPGAWLDALPGFLAAAAVAGVSLSLRRVDGPGVLIVQASFAAMATHAVLLPPEARPAGPFLLATAALPAVLLVVMIGVPARRRTAIAMLATLAGACVALGGWLLFRVASQPTLWRGVGAVLGGLAALAAVNIGRTLVPRR